MTTTTTITTLFTRLEITVNGKDLLHLFKDYQLPEITKKLKTLGSQFKWCKLNIYSGGKTITHTYIHNTHETYTLKTLTYKDDNNNYSNEDIDLFLE